MKYTTAAVTTAAAASNAINPSIGVVSPVFTAVLVDVPVKLPGVFCVLLEVGIAGVTVGVGVELGFGVGVGVVSLLVISTVS